MDYMLYSLTPTGPTPLPHGTQSRFHTEAEAVARAQELRGEAAALGDSTLPGYAVVLETTGETIREIKDAAPCGECGTPGCDGAPCRPTPPVITPETATCPHGEILDDTPVDLACHRCALDLVVTLRADITALLEENAALRDALGEKAEDIERGR